ncbi:hypothetical protein AAIE21_27115 [Paenibacillus sp. 102]|uniref:hypothetical protein n=1 Tax=Paenibacillus sp. 102 TaxID=3120823 RepID=UPI0031B9ECB8
MPFPFCLIIKFTDVNSFHYIDLRHVGTRWNMIVYNGLNELNMLEEVEGKLAQMLPYGFIDILYRFSWQKNLSFSPQKADMNREFLGMEDVTEKKSIHSVNYIDTKVIVDSVTHNDKYVTGYAKPYSTIVLMNGDVLIGSGRVDRYGKFRIHTYHHLKEHSIIKAQVIFDGFYQESVTIHVN